MASQHSWIKLILNLRTLGTFFTKFAAFKADKLYKKRLDEKARFIGLAFRAKLSRRHKDYVLFDTFDTVQQ